MTFSYRFFKSSMLIDFFFDILDGTLDSNAISDKRARKGIGDREESRIVYLDVWILCCRCFRNRLEVSWFLFTHNCL